MQLYIKETRFEPLVIFNDGVITIQGRSIPVDSNKLFQPLISSFFHYSKKPNPYTEINIQLEYINSSSNRSLMNLLIIAENMHKKGYNIIVNWYHEPEDELMMDHGNIFKSLLQIPFHIHKINGR